MQQMSSGYSLPTVAPLSCSKTKETAWTLTSPKKPHQNIYGTNAGRSNWACFWKTPLRRAVEHQGGRFLLKP